MTKAWKIITGYKRNFYGEITNEEIAKYFFNKEDAETLFNEGIIYTKTTVITTIYADETTKTSTTGSAFYERTIKNAETLKNRNKNIKDIIVELKEVPFYRYRMEEIEII